MTKQQILTEARTLNPQERAELIDDLRQMSDDDLTREQIAEIRRRAEAVDRGEPTIPGEQVMQELFEHLKKR